MDERENADLVIHCACPLFACRVCRTKTGWRHQVWCRVLDLTDPGCPDCRYYNPDHAFCTHPARERRLRACGKNQHSL